MSSLQAFCWWAKKNKIKIIIIIIIIMIIIITEKAAVNKTTKYVAQAATHSFVPVVIETSGAWCPQ